jgi:hypothetical protein
MRYGRCEYAIQTLIRSFSDELSAVLVKYMYGAVRTLKMGEEVVLVLLQCYMVCSAR